MCIRDRIIKDEKAELKPCPPYLKNTVHVSGFSEERLKLKHPGTKARVIQMLEKQIVTKDVLEEVPWIDRKSTRLNSSHIQKSRMPSSA